MKQRLLVLFAILVGGFSLQAAPADLSVHNGDRFGTIILTSTRPPDLLAPAQRPGILGCLWDDSHERWQLKTRSKPGSLVSAEAVSVTDVLGWDVPQGHHDTETTAIDPRETKAAWENNGTIF
jgi:hypothetical protein